MKTIRHTQSLFVLMICITLALLTSIQPAQATPISQQQPLFPDLELSTSKTIKITDSGFDPATLSLFGPTDVTWVNNTNSTHVLRSGDAPAATGKIFLPLIQRGSPAAVAAASVYLDYLNQEVQADSFSVTLAPGESFTYHFTTPGAVKFYLESNPAIKGTVTLSGVGLTRVSPSNGEGDVAVTRETILEFSGALDPASVTNAAFVARAGSNTLDYRLNLSADKTRVTLFYKEPLPGSTRVRVSVDGNQLKDTQGNAVDIDGDGVAGGNSTIEFDTLSLTVLPDTVVCGRVFASELAVTASNVSVNTPLKDVTVSVDGTELKTKTDVNGNFCLNPAPVGRFFVHVDGHSATNNIPAGQYYPMVGKAWQSTAGKQTSVGDIFLPLIPANTLQPVSQSSDTQITFVDSVWQQHPDLKGVSIKVPANSLFNDDGERGGKVGIAPVPPDRLPGKLPEGLNFPVVITVQTDGAMNFDRPAPVCFPNLPDPDTGEKLKAGSKESLYSFNHDTGNWEAVGAMTVTDDEKVICTDPGVGIRAPGWHGVGPVPITPPPPAQCVPLEASLREGTTLQTPCLSVPSPKPPPPPLPPLPCPGNANYGQCVADTCLPDLRDRQAECQKITEGPSATCEKLGLLGTYCRYLELPRGLCKKIEFLDFLQDGCDLGVWGGGKICELQAYDDYLSCELNCASQHCPSPSTFAPFQLLDNSRGINATKIDYPKAQQITTLYRDAINLLQPFVEVDDPAGLEPSDEIINQAKNLVNQASNISGGAPREVLLEYILQQEASFFSSFDEDSGNAPVYSVLYSAQVRRSDGDLTQLRGKTEPYGMFSLFLPRDGQLISVIFYDPLTNSYDYIYPRFLPNVRYRLPRFHLHPFDQNNLDSDDDKLPDLAEIVYGSEPFISDTDADGITDGAEIQNGSDPLDGLPAQTGILGTADTPGTALDVCVQNDLAVMSDGAMGVAVFNVFDSRNPTLVAQIDTPGMAQRVACGEGRVAVADMDKGLAIVDMRSVVTASVAFQLDLGSPTTAVAVAGNVAYAGTQNGRLVAVDLSTGTILQETSLAVRINDLALSGDLLYVLTDNNTLHTLDPRFELQLLNSVGTPSTLGNNQRLFAGSDLLYTTHGRGYDTFSLSVPTQPTLIAGGSTNQFGWRQIVSNGSKAGLAITGVNSNTPRDLSLYDVSDPSKTDQFQTQFTTPGDATSVALYKGLAYVADGASGLQIVNYLSFDSLGVAPTISVTTTFNGNKAEENSLARVTALVNDDVQVRQVDFYIDGQLVATDGTYPFEYRFVTPRMSAQTSFKLRVRAVDTGGNAGWSTEQTLTLVPDATAPRVLKYTPSAATNPADSVRGLTVTFSEAIKQSTLTTENLKILVAGADKQLGTADDTTVSGGTITYANADSRAALTFNSPLPAGIYRAKVAKTVSDLVGNQLAADFTWDFGIGQRIPIGGVVVGEISNAGEQDVYNFSASPNQWVYFDDRSASRPGYFYWRLQDSSGTRIFEDTVDGSDPGAHKLELGGDYSLTLWGYGTTTGTYQFQLRSNPPDLFAIKIGDVIKNGQPGVGAGNIELPGNGNGYTFTATADQWIYFDDQDSSRSGYFAWDIYDPSGKRVFLDYLNGDDPGAYKMPLTGQYTIWTWAYANVAGTYQFQLRSNPPDRFTIKIGDVIKDGQPGIGAGNIELPGNGNGYTFTATADQWIYFDDQNSSRPGYFAWDVYDPSGKRVFLDYLNGDDPGSYKMPLTGQYTIWTWAYANIAGTYQFQLRSNPPDKFAIQIGDVIRDGQPGVGAGNIELPGNTDVYTFTATADQWIYFDDQNSSRSGYFAWDVYDPSGKRVFLDYLNGDDPGSYKMPLTGQYTIYTWAYANIAGTYQFQLRSNPSDVFAINIGDVIRDGQPGIGAGNIELPGNGDLYTFTATADQWIYFDDQNSSRSGYFAWDIYDPSGKRVFLDYLDGNDPGAHKMPLTGKYTIYTWAYANIAGTYQFQLRANPPDQFAIDLGDTVQNGQPGAGAGNIEIPGNTDRYTFSAAPNQEVYFDDQGSSSNYNIYWQLYDPNGKQLFSRWLVNDDFGAIVLAGGTYTIVTGSNANVAGTYQFQLRSVSPDQFNLNIGDTVSNGIPGAGAGNIEQPGNKDIYTFQANSGRTVYFDDQGASSNYNIYWQLYDPKGTQLFSYWLNSNDPGARTLALTGTYTIVVAASANIAGTYQFQIRDATALEAANSVTAADSEDLVAAEIARRREEEEVTPNEQRIYLPLVNR